LELFNWRYSRRVSLEIFNGFCAIDIDKCIIDNNFSNLTQEILSSINSYAEYLPSKKGIILIVKKLALKIKKA